MRRFFVGYLEHPTAAFDRIGPEPASNAVVAARIDVNGVLNS